MEATENTPDQKPPTEADRCQSCGYIAWALVAGVCGACRRG